MGYVNSNIGDTSDVQLEKNMEKIKLRVKSGEITWDELLELRDREIAKMMLMPKTNNNLRVLDYVKRERKRIEEERDASND